MKKRILSILLALTMLLELTPTTTWAVGLPGAVFQDSGARLKAVAARAAEDAAAHASHPVCGAACDGHTESHVDVEWTEFPTGSTALTAGNYYLTDDITGSTPITISGEVNLCLNGQKIENPAGSGISVSSGATLNLCDCGEGGSVIGDSSTGAQSNYGIYNNGTLNVYSGSVEGKISHGISNNDTVNVYGGAITGKTRGINNSSNGTLNVYGGDLTGTTDYGIFNIGVFNLGGSPTISGGKADICLNQSNIQSVTVRSGLEGSYSVGLLDPTTATYPVSITAAASADYSGHFTSADAGYAIRNNGSGDEQVVQLYVPSPHSHPVCGAACSGHTESHEAVEFTALSADTTTLSGGSYYLTGDISGDIPNNATVTISGKVDLCLNGCKIENSTGHGIMVTSGGTLNLCDCTGGGAVIGNGSSGAGISTVNGDTINVYGGSVTGNGNGYGINSSGAKVNVYGGAVTSVNNWGINNAGSKGTVAVYGGVIAGKTRGIYNKGTLTVTGGSVTVTGGSGHGIYHEGGSFTLGGSPTIKGGGSTSADLYFATGKTVTVDSGGLTGGPYSVGAATAPTEAASVAITAPASADYSDRFTSINASYAIRNSGSGDEQVVQLYKPHSHSWASAWQTDATHHWHDCTATGCTVTENSEKNGYTAHTPVTDAAVAATCTTAGKTEGSHCSVCSYVIKAQTTIDAIGHNYGAWTITAEPTTEATGTAERVCENDGTHKDTGTVPALADTTVWTAGAKTEPTEDTDGSQVYTSKYGTVTVTIPALGHTHTWGAWSIKTAPTAEATGTAERVCETNSNHKDTFTLPALTDTDVWTPGEKTEPTEDTDGSQVYTSEYGAVTVTIPALSHTHTWGAWSIKTEPTAEATGTAERVCATNSEHKDTFTLPALTDADVWTPGEKTEPTEDTDGSQVYTSEYGTVTVTIPATGSDHTHAYGDWSHSETNHWHECTAGDCPDPDKGKKDETAHTEDSGTVTTAPTGTDAGVKTYKCTVCDRVLRTEDIPALGFGISGKVTEEDEDGNETPMSDAAVRLTGGGRSTDVTTDEQGEYSFTGVAPGIYNVVVTKDDQTKTILVEIRDGDVAVQAIKMDGKKYSVVEVKGQDTPAVVVGGVDAVAEAQDVNQGDTVTVKLTVEAKTESAAVGASAIKQTAGGKTLEYIDLTLTKQINNNAATNIGGSNTRLLTIVIPFTKGDKENITVYRYHGDQAETLPTAANADGEYFTVGDTAITVYAKKFSTYAIGYTEAGTTYTLTVNGGTGSGSYAAGAAVNISATIPSGKRFTGWTGAAVANAASASTTLTMPAQNTTVTANFQNISSGGGSSDDSSSQNDEYDFWQDVSSKIEKASSGDIVKVNSRGYDQLSWSVMEALRQKTNVTLIITWNGGEDIVIPSSAALYDPLRIYWPLSYLAGYDFGTGTITNLNPETGGVWIVDAPATTDPPADPTVTDPRRGLADTPELAAKGIEQAVPGITEPEVVSPSESATSTAKNPVLPLMLVIMLAAICCGVWAWKSRKDVEGVE